MLFNATIDLAQMRAGLVALVKRFGFDHVATTPNGGKGCIYYVVSEEGMTPVCIVGQWFASRGLLGLLSNTLPQPGATYDDNLGTCSPASLMWTRLADLGVEVTTDAQTYARNAQYGQDNGLTWGQAIAYADSKVIWEATQTAKQSLGIFDYAEGLDVGDFRDYRDPEAEPVSLVKASPWEEEDDMPF